MKIKGEKMGFRYLTKAFCIYLLVFSFFMLSASQTVEVGKTDKIMTAVYAYCDYEIELTNATYANDGSDNGRMLTDLIYTSAKIGSNEKGEGWVRIKSKNSSAYSASVTLDFGFVANDVFRLYLRAFRGSSFKAEMPKKISFYASSDGKSFEYIGNGTTVTNLNADNTSAVFGVTLKSGITARYVRAVMECNGNYELWINEVGAASDGNTFSANSDGNGFIYDNQGLVYRINKGVAEIYDMETEPKGQHNTLKPSKSSFNTDNTTYYLGVGSDNEVKVITDFIGDGALNYSGVPNNIKYIVIHNTATVEESTDAERYNYRMHNMNGESSWHYTVDENVIYHSLADSVVGFHSGASHNYQSIGIEICVNGAPYVSENKFVFSGGAYDNWVNTRFRKSLRNTAVLVAELLTRYGLSTDAVIQHYDVTAKDCPLWMRANNSALWKEFLGLVEHYYSLINGKTPSRVTQPASNIVIPDYIRLNNGDVFPVTSICSDAFADKGNFLKSVVIGKSVENIPIGCFDGNPLLERVTVASGNKHFKTSSGNILYDNDGKEIFNPKKANLFTEPDAKDGCLLDIRRINGTYFIFDNAVSNDVSYYADAYGANQFSAIDINGKKLSNNSIAGTGTQFTFDGARLYLILLGDADGDGYIGATDYVLVKRACLDTFFPVKRQFHAMTVNGNDDIGVIDYIMIKRHVLGTYDLTK